MNINGYSFARVVLHMYFPAMYLYDLSADSQPQTCPTAFGGEKRVENVGNNIWRYAASSILDGDDHRSLVFDVETEQ